MKATIEVPDELYRQVKAKSALEGRAVREAAIPAWFGAFEKYARRVERHDMESIRESIGRGVAVERAP